MIKNSALLLFYSSIFLLTSDAVGPPGRDKNKRWRVQVVKKNNVGPREKQKIPVRLRESISRNLSLFLQWRLGSGREGGRRSKKIISTIRIFRFHQTPIYFSKSRQILLLVYNWILPVSPNHPDISPSL